MSLQNIITYREDNKEEESNTLENYVNNKDNEKTGRESKNINNEINFNNDKNNLNSSSHYSNSNYNINEKEIENENNNEHNIDDKKEDSDNINININNLDLNKENNNIITENNINDINNMNDINNINNNQQQEKEEKIEEKDIIDELLDKIRNNQDLGIPKEDPKKAFENLEQELKLGLEQLNQIKTGSNKKTILDTQNELVKKSFERNKKYNEVISELTKNIKKSNNNVVNKYKRGTYYNYKNLFILNPRFYFQEEKKNKIHENPKRNEERFYMSNIDGKVIINGERKNVDNFDNNNNYSKTYRRYYSFDKKKNTGLNNLQSFGIRKINCYDKNYFMRELNKINNFLFS